MLFHYCTLIALLTLAFDDCLSKSSVLLFLGRQEGRQKDTETQSHSHKDFSKGQKS